MESYWKDNKVNIGEVASNTNTKITFHAKDNIPGIIEILPGCGCTDYRYDAERGKMHITYSSGRYPRHLGSGELNFTQYVRITYNNGQRESLIIEGVKTK